MRINNHKLTGAKDIPSPNTSGRMNTPTALVLHYTASGSNTDGDAKYFQRRNAGASAHLVIERDGSIAQCVPFNTKAWHAGRSSWKGRSGCNSFTIGIEIDNWGLLEKRGDGNYYSWAGEKIPTSSVYVGPNKLGNGRYWEKYTNQQLQATDAAIGAIVQAYPTITDIIGHEDIAPRRKVDPGPALYGFINQMEDKYISQRSDDQPIKAIVKATSLNVRSSPGGAKVASVAEGKIVDVLYSQGEWSRITWPAGWVHNGYLQAL